MKKSRPPSVPIIIFLTTVCLEMIRPYVANNLTVFIYDGREVYLMSCCRVTLWDVEWWDGFEGCVRELFGLACFEVVSCYLIIIIIFINCNWVVTRWQWLFYMHTKYEIVC